MLMDALIAIIFTSVAAGALFLNEDKIQYWVDSKRGRKLGWRD